MGAFLQDFRGGIRAMARNKGYTLVALTALTLGIGATTAIFSVVKAVLLNPLPYANPDRLVVIWERNLQLGLPKMVVAPPNYHDWTQANSVFSAIGAYDEDGSFLAARDRIFRVRSARITASMFRLLGVEALEGRIFEETEDDPGAVPSVILSERLWNSQFARDKAILGRTIRLDDQDCIVVGIMPSRFQFPPPIALEGTASARGADLWVPMNIDMAQGQRGAHFMTVLGRLAPGVGMAAAENEMEQIAHRLGESYPTTNAQWDVALTSLDDEVLGGVRPQLLILLGAVGVVLLIACVNVAGLMLARGTSRKREFAIRCALGANRGRLTRQLLTESQILALLGGGGGLVVAVWGTWLLLRFSPPDVFRLAEAHVDVGVLLFALAVALVTGAAFGLVPAWQAFSAEPNQRLRDGGRSGTEGKSGGRMRSALVVAEVALSLILLVAAGLLFASFLKLRGVDTGFQKKDVVTARLTFNSTRYPQSADRGIAVRRLRELLTATPRIEQAGFIYDIPLAADRQGTEFQIEGWPQPGPQDNRQISASAATPGYFQAMGIPVVRGREFDEHDTSESEAVVVVNQAFADRFFSDQDPVGKTMHLGFSYQIPRRIVGIVQSVRHSTMGEPPAPTAYLNYVQYPAWRSVYLVVRSRVDAESLLPALRGAVRDFDPQLALYDVRSIEQVIADAVSRPRFSAFLFAVFSGVALMLACVGIYGVVSYSVGRRIRETGIRRVLGAHNRDILRIVARQGVGLAFSGIVVGLLGALAVNRLLATQLFQVSPFDPAVYGGVALLLLAIAVMACIPPASRALRVHPMEALRSE